MLVKESLKYAKMWLESDKTYVMQHEHPTSYF